MFFLIKYGIEIWNYKLFIIFVPINQNIMNNFIALEYKLYSIDENGKHLREQTSEGKPFSFISGLGYTLEAFEHQVDSLKSGEEFDFQLTPEQAYGEREDERILTLDRSIFQINGHFDNEHIYKGADVPMQNEDGMRLNGHVIDITDDKVIMDFNHPLAGDTIEYVGKIIENRKATETEIKGFINFFTRESCQCDCEHDHGCNGDCHHDHCGCGHCH